MEWIKRLTRALDYVENNLAGELDSRNVAEQANLSSFHFQRMFSILADVTLAEYIRRRRLTLAASEIHGGKSILETAIKYGYESQASFTRAFQRLHGFSPGMTREPGMKIKAYPPISFHLTIKGEHSMDYEIRELKAFKIAGLVRRFTTVEDRNLREIPLFWQELDQANKVEPILTQADRKGLLKGALLGVCMNFCKETQDFEYVIGVEPGPASNLAGLEERPIPARTWAVFKGAGLMPAAIQKVWKRIYGEWFPATDYIHDDGPELEVYLDSGGEPESECPFEVWIPVRKEK